MAYFLSCGLFVTGVIFVMWVFCKCFCLFVGVGFVMRFLSWGICHVEFLLVGVLS